LIVPKRLPKNAFHSVSFDSETDILFGNHEAYSAVWAIGRKGEKQKILAGNLVPSLLENQLEVRSTQ